MARSARSAGVPWAVATGENRRVPLCAADDDPERIPLTGAHQRAFFVFSGVLLAAVLIAGTIALAQEGGQEASLGIVLLALPLLGGLAWWRWGTSLRQVAATRTGLRVSGLRGERFVPYASVESVREILNYRSRTIVVRLREPVAGLRHFAFIPAYRPDLGFDDEHPTTTDLRRRLAAATNQTP